MRKLLGAACALLLMSATAATAADPKVEIRTNLGAIVVELYPAKAPKTVENFLQYANSGFYRDVVFHRVIPGFMIQGGGFSREMAQKPTRAPIPIESDNGLKNDTGTIAMARTANPNSATAQFFINVADNAFLNYRPGSPGYTVFGRVVKGMDVVDRIARVPTGAGGPFPQDVPQQPVVIEDIIVPEEK
ncbi:MAG TPA: peptidylprolyl isomerase [Burkholderiales bacterium]|nr:peptidylprolyl isomerase [Burkholderiales bacterium]